MRLLLLIVLLAACRQDPDDYKPEPVDTGWTGGDTEDGDGYSAAEGDCDESNAEVNPGAEEICDGIDNNCDGQIDEGTEATWYADADGDGFGDAATSMSACEPDDGYVATADDCDDADPATHPGASEDDCTDPVDHNCDGSVGYADADGDGTPACEDCDDGDAAFHPGAAETCDGRDEDCDGEIDEDVESLPTWYADADGDGWGDAGSSSAACDAPEGTTASPGDCDDADATTYPGAPEEDCADPIDHNCDGSVAYADADGDGVPACEDCDDAAATVFPGADETCDGIDEDCDGTIDEDAIDAAVYYADTDGDGYGDPTSVTADCSAPAGFVADATDCDDAAADVYPGADEVCDGLDQDCDGSVDEDPIDGDTWYFDGDCDGEGDSVLAEVACAAPGDDWVVIAGDCDDLDSRASTTGVEVCNGVDDNCDGTVDESCNDATLIGDPSGDPVDSPAVGAACATLGELTTSANPHLTTSLSTYMDILDGTSSGLASSVDMDADLLDFSIRCGSDYTASPGNYSPTTAWPALPSTAASGAARFRGYLNIGCGEPLDRTFGLIGNDSLSLSIEGETILDQDWTSGQWKTFTWVSFPGPGLYAFEVEWATNLTCEIDPFELVWAEGFVAGYDDYDTMCAFGTCTYGDGETIPGFSVIGDTSLVQTTTGAAGSCAQCDTDADCAAGACNSAGLCE